MAATGTMPTLIDGEHSLAESGDVVESVNPATGESLGSFPRCRANDVARAVESSQRAFHDWRELHPEARARYLLDFAELVDSDRERLLMLDVRENGSPVSEMEVDVGYGLDRLRYFAGLALEIRGHTMNTGWERLNYTLRQPYGVVARIIPFNHPAMFFLARMGAPLVAGNTLVIKPSEWTSLSALALAEHAASIFPPGVVNVVTGFGHEAGDALVTHPNVRRIAIIGSVETGMKIAQRAATSGIKEVTHELGGKNPIIIWPDADFEAAIDGVIRGMRFNFQGQACGSTSRLLVHEEAHDAFVETLVERIDALRVGMPEEPSTQVGAIVNEPQLRKVLGFISVGREDGGTLRLGGERLTHDDFGKGYFVPPTVISHVKPDNRLWNGEVFGPVLATMPYSDYNEAIRLANDIPLGLTATLYTNDLALAHRFARDIEAGYVWVNDNQQHFHGTPFGGLKNSGTGSEESFEELESYTEVKNVNIRFDAGIGVRAT